MKFSLFLGVTMTKTKMDRYLLAAMGCTHIIPQNTQKEASMPQSVFPQNCRSVTLSRGFQSSHNTWVNKMRFDRAAEKTRVWGRIKDTGANFIVEGWKVAFHPNPTEWVQIPCANLATAQIHLISVMDKDAFQREKTRQANGI